MCATCFRGYAQLLGHRNFMLLALASGMPFNGMFLYVLSAPAFLGELLGLAPTQFFWFFCMTIGGIMGGAWLSGRLAGRIGRASRSATASLIMVVVSIDQCRSQRAVYCAVLVGAADNRTVRVRLVADGAGGHDAGAGPGAGTARAGIFAAGRGRQRANGLVAGALAPLVMHSTLGLAVASFGMMCIGLVAWQIVRRKLQSH